jgi:omega-amidase
MRISLVQDSIIWADKAANLEKFGKQIESLSGLTDLVVLPEMFTTGFCTDQLHLAESMEGMTVRQLKTWAIEFKLAITGSFIATEQDKIFNRCFFVFPNGEIQTADKRHLFSLGGEDKLFTAGNKFLLVNYKGFKIRVIVCYDIRFPIWTRNVNNAYDLLICVANFPHRRISDWDILLKARALENQVYVCGVNRVGVDGADIHYSGHSVLLDAQAKELVSFDENEIEVLTTELSIEKLEHYRSKFSVWKDADAFDLKI